MNLVESLEEFLGPLKDVETLTKGEDSRTSPSFSLKYKNFSLYVRAVQRKSSLRKNVLSDREYGAYSSL